MNGTEEIGISIIAKRYSDALIELGEKGAQLDEFDKDLQNIRATLDLNEDLVIFLEHPTISVDEKKEIIDRIFGNFISKYVMNFMKLLLDKNRIFIFPAIVSNYHLTLNKIRNISVANIITAVEIDEETINRVKEKLEKLFKQKIEVQKIVDPEIIAGMIIKVGDKTIDGSIKTKLENMKRHII